MRKKVQVSTIMGECEERRQSKASHEMYSEVDAFSSSVRDAAISLYAISHVSTFYHGTREYQCDIASKLFAIVGVVSKLSTVCPRSEQSLFDLQKIEVLKKTIASCELILDKINDAAAAAAKKANALLDPALNCPEASQDILIFTPDEASAAKNILQSCFHGFSMMAVAARTQGLGQKAELTDEQTFEGHRLSETLKHPQFNVIPESGVSLPHPDKAPRSTNTSQPGETSLPYHTHLATPQPQYQFQPRRQPQNNCASWAPHQWPQYHSTLVRNEDHLHSLHFNMASEPNKNDKVAPSVEPKNDTPVNTPASTLESTPAAESAQGPLAPEAEGGDVDGPMTPSFVGFGGSKVDAPSSTATQSAVTSRASAAYLLKGGGQAGAKAPILPPVEATRPSNAPTSTTLKLGPLHHLEAYMLQPHVETTKEYITWASKIELLHLDETTMQEHLEKLGANYSIIDAMGKLLPEQIRLVQACTVSRNGHLVSVQQGAPADMVTQMGTFQIKPVIFVITTAALPERQLLQDSTSLPASAIEAKRSAFGDFTNNHPPFLPTQPTSTPPGFGTRHFPTNGPARATPFSGPLRPNNGTSLFGTPIPNPTLPLQDQCNDCFLVEPDGHSGRAAYNHYTTITMSERYKNNSLEELRLADYAAGRVGPTKTQDFSYPWEKQKTTETDPQKPFGGQYIRPTLGVGSGSAAVPPSAPPAGGLFGGASSSGSLFGGKPVFGGGLFSNLAQSGQQQQPTGGLFGAKLSSDASFGLGGFGTHSNACGGLFRQCTTPGQGLFGTAPAAPSTGLFGCAQSSSAGGLFGASSNAPSTSLFTTAPASSSGTGLFGNASNAPFAGLFSTAPAAPSTGLFSQAPAPLPGSGPFGTYPNAQSTGPFNTAPTFLSGAGLFGKASDAPSTGLFGTAPQSASTSGGFGTGGFGSNSTTANPLSGCSSAFSNSSFNPPFSTNPFSQPALSHDNTPTNPLPSTTSAPADATANQSTPPRICKKCGTSLVFHPPAEQSAGLCDACKGNKQSMCWLCKRTTKGDTSATLVPPPPTAFIPTASIPTQATSPPTAETEQPNNTMPLNSRANFLVNENGTTWSQPSSRAAPSNSNVFAGFGTSPATPAEPVLSGVSQSRAFGFGGPGFAGEIKKVDPKDDKGKGK